jgi:Tol biopolymer transport system component
MKARTVRPIVWVLGACLLAVMTVMACTGRTATVQPTPGGAAARGDLPEPPLSDEVDQSGARLAARPTSSSAVVQTPEPLPELATLTPPATATAVPRPTPSPTPTLPTLRQLTQGGCCTQPFWSADSQRVLFIDDPPGDPPLAIWGVDIARPAAEPEVAFERIGFYTAGFTYLIETRGDTTIVERLSDGERWSVPAGGRPVTFSPSRDKVAWSVSNDAPFERRVTQVWVAQADGSGAERVAELRRGGLQSWVSDDVLLLSSYDSFDSREQAYFTLSLSSGETRELVREERLRGSVLSPDRTWLAYFLTFSEDAQRNGVWLVRTDGSERLQLDASLFGAYQWRDDERLVIVPFNPGATYHELWEYDVATDSVRQLTDSDVTPLKIANGDWEVSPDGRHVAFVESRDNNIWLLELPQ